MIEGLETALIKPFLVKFNVNESAIFNSEKLFGVLNAYEPDV